MAANFPLQIFYDGSCVVCSAEMDRYRKSSPEKRLLFIDISDETFSAEGYGKTQQEFMDRLHVCDAAGNFSVGVDAFMQIWQAYPSGSLCRLFSGIIGLPGVHLLSRFGYNVFARYRHLLPKRERDCKSGSCNLNH